MPFHSPDKKLRFLTLSVLLFSFSVFADPPRLEHFVLNGCEVGFEAKHPLKIVRGVTKSCVGSLGIDLGNPVGNIQGNVNINVQDIKTSSPIIDRVIQGMLRQSQYPEIHYQVESATLQPGHTGKKPRFVLAGNLKINGVTRPYNLPVSCDRLTQDMVCQFLTEIVLSSFRIESPQILRVGFVNSVWVQGAVQWRIQEGTP